LLRTQYNRYVVYVNRFHIMDREIKCLHIGGMERLSYALMVAMAVQHHPVTVRLIDLHEAELINRRREELYAMNLAESLKPRVKLNIEDLRLQLGDIKIIEKKKPILDKIPCPKKWSRSKYGR